jgi:hypothetical protein
VGESVRAYEELLDKIMASAPDTANDLRMVSKLSAFYEALAALYRRNGKPAKASEIAARRLGIWRAWDGKLPGNPYVARQLAAGHGV